MYLRILEVHSIEQVVMKKEILEKSTSEEWESF